MFGLSIWMRFEPTLEEWVEFLDMYVFYIGVYVLIGTSVIVMAIAFIGCAAALMENILVLYIVRTLINQSSMFSKGDHFGKMVSFRVLQDP